LRSTLGGKVRSTFVDCREESMATVNARYTVDDVNTVDPAGNLIELFQPVG